ncbi:MAG TPA: DUF2683 family protein [Candidatus Nanoarchaeia archaeon]|nr:DUF2683 family protein [Candidatus Nanoarchaeia archaeon]
MVQTFVNLDETANRIVNIVKAKHGLKDKTQAINLLVHEYGAELLEPELRPEFVNKIKHLEKHGKFTRHESMEDFRKDIET